MAAQVCSSVYSSVHCHTFPTMSITPNGLAPSGWASTSLAGSMVLPRSASGAGAFLESVPQLHGEAPAGRGVGGLLGPLGGLSGLTPLDAIDVGAPARSTGGSQSQFPQGYVLPSVSCAAYCHSHS